MTDKEYIDVQKNLCMLANDISALPLIQFLHRARTADACGAILDPTLYRAAHRTLENMIQLAERAIELVRALQLLQNVARVDAIDHFQKQAEARKP